MYRIVRSCETKTLVYVYERRPEYCRRRRRRVVVVSIYDLKRRERTSSHETNLLDYGGKISVTVSARTRVEPFVTDRTHRFFLCLS